MSTSDQGVDAGVDLGPVVKDLGADAAMADQGPSCEPFKTAAPPPAALGGCEETLSKTPRSSTRVPLDGVELVKDIFIKMRGSYALHSDLYLPNRAAKTGALVVVHGGGWLDCANRKDDISYYAQAIAGVLSVPTLNVEYRLAQEGGYPENVMDVKCAVQWLRANASSYNIDPDRIGIMGSSAGAHLALMVALTEDRKDLDPGCGELPAEVTLTLAYSGPSDLPQFVDSSSISATAPTYYTGEDCNVPITTCHATRACQRCVDASPLAQACNADGDPILLFQAPDPLDVFVPQAQNERLAQALKEAGADVTLLMPTAEQLAAHGCTGELDKGSHGADLCMLLSTKPALDGAVLKALGPR